MGVRLVGDVRQLNAKLKKLQKPRLQKAAREVGEALVSSIIERFSRQRDPSGNPWQPLAASTVAPSTSDYKKKGGLRKGVEERLKKRKILIQSARLRNSITSRTSGTKVYVGTNLIYAPIHQNGGQAGRSKKVTIPARPFLGISTQDQAEITRIVTRVLEE
jgi:phage virion morphogenesis protein